jgi:hypothetical protein
MRTQTATLATIALLGAAAPAANATTSLQMNPPAGRGTAPPPVAVQCVIADQGALTRCSLLSESPAGAGIGAAALDVAPMFRRPAGAPGQVITIPMRFVLNPGQTIPTQAATSAP